MSEDPLRLYARFHAKLNGLNPDDYEKQLDAESSFDPSAVSPKGARGVAQFMPATGKQYGLNTTDDLHDPIKSIRSGAKYMADLKAQANGDEEAARVGYNAGPRAMQRFQRGGRIPSETSGYIKKINGDDPESLYEKFQSQLKSAAPTRADAADGTAVRVPAVASPSSGVDIAGKRPIRVQPEAITTGRQFNIPSGGFQQSAPQAIAQNVAARQAAGRGLSAANVPAVAPPSPYVPADDEITAERSRMLGPGGTRAMIRSQDQQADEIKQYGAPLADLQREGARYLRSLPKGDRKAALQKLAARGRPIGDEEREAAGVTGFEKALINVGAPMMKTVTETAAGAFDVPQIPGVSEQTRLRGVQEGLRGFAKEMDTAENIAGGGPLVKFGRAVAGTAPLVAMPGGMPAFVVQSYLQAKGEGADNSAALKHAATTAAGLYAGGKLSHEFEKQVQGTVQRYLARSGGLAAGLTGASAVADEPQSLESLGHTAGISLLLGLPHGVGKKPASKASRRAPAGAPETRGAADVSTGQSPSELVPEPPEAITAQLEALRAGRGNRRAVLVPTEDQMPVGKGELTAQGLTTTKTPVGTFVHISDAKNPLYLSHGDVRKMVADGTYHQALGFVEPKGPTATEAVTARDEKGVELQAAMTSPENVPAQVAELQAQHPRAEIAVEPPEKVVADRAATIPQQSQGRYRLEDAEPTEPDLHHSNYQPREEGKFAGEPEYPAEDVRGAETRRAAAYDKLVALRRESENKLFQASNLSANETDRVRAKFESLKGEVTPKRPLKTVVEEYLRQGSLYGAHELNPDQQELLRDLASPGRRAPLKVEQQGLFAEGIQPTLESRIADQETRRVPGVSGGLFGAQAEAIDVGPKAVKKPTETRTEAGAKEPWQMTREEHFRAVIEPATERLEAATEALPDDLSLKEYREAVKRLDERFYKEIRPDHDLAVADALKAGKSVPPEVLADYPEFQAEKAERTVQMRVPSHRTAGRLPSEIRTYSGMAKSGVGFADVPVSRIAEMERIGLTHTAESRREQSQVDKAGPTFGGRQRYSPEVEQAFADWKSGRAYVDNAGTYRLKEEQTLLAGKMKWTGKGKPAPWNRAVREAFSDSRAFHDAASGNERGLFQRASQMIGILNREGKLVGTASLSQDSDPAKFVREQYGRGFTYGELKMEGEQPKQLEVGTPEGKLFQRNEEKKQTDTPEFERWFGDSKARYADGDQEPIVLYHGTDSDFAKFAKSHTGKVRGNKYGKGAFFFTDNPRVAGGYAGDDSSWTSQSHPNVMPVYLKIERPLVVDAAGESWVDVEQGAFSRARRGNHDGIIFKDVADYPDFETMTEPSMTTYVVFEPTQIKSAIGNRGTFDPNNPNILFQADQSPEHKILSDVIGDFAKEGIRDFRTAARQFRDSFGPATEYGEMFQDAWDANKNVKKRGKLTFDDALEDAPMKKRRTLTQAVIDNGRLKSTGFSGKGEKRQLSVKEGGRLGLFSDRGVNPEDMMRTLEAEGWNFEDDLNKFFEALRDEAGGRPHYSMEGASEWGSEEVERHWEEMGRKEFAEKSDHSIMSKAFDNPEADEYKPWVESYDEIRNAKAEPHPEDVDYFKELSHDLGLSPEAINRLIETGHAERRAETLRDQSAEQNARGSATVPTDAASFKQGLVDHFKYSPETADTETAVADALISTLAKESGKSKESWYKTIWIAHGGKGEGLEQGREDLTGENFKRYFGDWQNKPENASKVVDDEGKPLQVYGGHSNLEMYGEKYDSRLGTAGGSYWSESPEIASNYAQGKLGGKEEFTEGSQYRFKLKNGKFGKKIWQMELSPEQQQKARDFLSDEDNANYDVERYWRENANYDASSRRALIRGGLRDLQSIWQFLEYMGENIAYAKEEPPGERVPYWMRQRQNTFEDMLDHLGIEWRSRDWAQPGVMPVYLNIRNPLDAEKPFPADVLVALKKASVREKRLTQAEMDYAHWTSEYPLRQWVEDIESGNEYWTTQIPKKAISILKSFGYDGIKELGQKGAKTREERQTNWVAFDDVQIKSVFNKGTFDPNNPNFLKQSARGMTSFLKTGQAVIRALQNPNESTAVHEIHHWAVVQFMDLAEKLRLDPAFLRMAQKAGEAGEGADPQLVKDMGHMARWMNLRDAAHFNELHEQYQNGTLKGRELKRYIDAQERGARGFEKYLRTGKAPTLALEAAFSRFKEWLTNIYQNLKGSEIDIDIGTRQTAVWDRMLGGKGESGPKVTSIKNAVTEAERADRGLDPIEKSLRRDFGTVLNEGKKLVDDNPYFRESVIADLIQNPRAPSDAEDAALAYDRMKLYNEHRGALRELGDAVEGDDGTAIVQTGYKLKAIEEAIDLNDRAAKLSGTESGRSLNARKMMIRDDYSMATMIQKAKVAAREAGKTLSPETEQTIRDMAEQIAEKDSLLDARERYITELESQRAREEKVQNWRAKTVRQPRSKDALDSELLRMQDHFALLARGGESGPEKPRGLFQADQYEGPFTDEMRKLIKDMARNRVEAGARTAENVNEQVHRIVSQYLPEVDPRDVGDVWSEYGKVAKLSMEEIDVAMREAKRQQRLLAALEDLEAGQTPLRSGLTRDKQTERVRQLNKLVSAEMRKMGLRDTRSPEERWATALESIKTNLRNSIADMTKRLETGERPAKRVSTPLDAEAKALKAQRDALAQTLRDIEGPRKLTDQERIQMSERGLEKSIANLDERIKAGELSPRSRTSMPWSAKVSELQAQRQVLTDRLKEMRKAVRPVPDKDAARIKASERALQKSIDELTERIKTGNLAARSSASAAWSPEVGKLQAQRKVLADILKDLRDAAKPPKDKDAALLKAFKTRVEKSAKEYQRRLDEGDFTTTKKATLEERGKLDPEAKKLAEQRDAVKAQYQRQLEEMRPGKGWRTASALRKSWMLSGLSTQLKNTLGTGAYQIFDEASRMPAVIMDAAISPITGQRSITGLSPVAILDSIVAAGKVGGREFVETIKHGATAEQMAQHQFGQEVKLGKGWGEGKNAAAVGLNSGLKVVEVASKAVFRVMSGSDRIFYQGALRRNLVDRATVQAKNEARTDKGLNVRQRAKDLIANPSPELQASAIHDALVSTFNNSNTLSERVKRFRSSIRKEGESQLQAEKRAAIQNFAIDLIMPFDRTPTNVIARILEASPYGFGRNAKQIAQAVIRGSMSVEQQRDFSRTFGRATTGSSLMALGYYLAGRGILSGLAPSPSDRKKDKDEGIEPNSIKLGNQWWPAGSVSPTGNLLTIGAGLYREVHRDKPGIGKMIGTALQPLADQPMLKGANQVADVFRDPSRGAAGTAASFGFSFVPFSGALRDISKVADPAPRRFPSKEANLTGLKEQFQQNIAGWRNKLPTEPEKKGDGAVNPYTRAIDRYKRSLRHPGDSR